MYEQHWDLQCPPFGTIFDERFFFPGESHRVSLAKLDWAIHRRHEAVLLSGGFGSGKTMLMQMLGGQLSDEFAPIAHVVFPPLGATPLLAYIAEELGLTIAHEEDIHRTLRRIEELLRDNAGSGKHGLLIIDEAHLLKDSATLETLRMLTNFHREGRPLLTLVLIGQPPLLSTVSRLPQLDSRLAAKCVLRPFSLQETSAYVEHRLNAAGAGSMIFQSDALHSVHALSGGVPRLINRLCELAMLLAFGEQSRLIDTSQVERVGMELSPAIAAS